MWQPNHKDFTLAPNLGPVKTAISRAITLSYSDARLYLFKERANLLPHPWRLTVEIVRDKELNPLHFFWRDHFCAPVTFTKQT